MSIILSARQPGGPARPRRAVLRCVLCALLSGLLLALAAPRAGALDVGLELVADGLIQPVAMVSPPGDERRFIVEQIGRVRVLMPDGHLLEQPFLDVSHRMVRLDPTFDERGLLGLAFHPEFADNGRLYVYYSAPLRPGADPRFDHTARLSEFRILPGEPNRVDPDSERVVLEVDEPQINHNAGGLAFGPDGYLYLALGDGGDPGDQAYGHAPEGNGQAPGTLLGKVLRIDVDGHPYRIPDDNPFVGDPSYRPEIYALGLRNPYRCTFDAAGNGDLYCGDVGEGSYEEVDLVRKGGNYGWRVREGRHCFDAETLLERPDCEVDGLIDPIVEYENCTAKEPCVGRSIIGGYMYRGDAIPELRGKYVFGDWAAEMDELGPPLHAAAPPADGEGPWTLERLRVARPYFHSYIIGFGQDSANELYVLATNSVGPDELKGKVYKIVPAG